jgi:hypothetical protein
MPRAGRGIVCDTTQHVGEGEELIPRNAPPPRNWESPVFLRVSAYAPLVTAKLTVAFGRTDLHSDGPERNSPDEQVDSAG